MTEVITSCAGSPVHPAELNPPRMPAVSTSRYRLGVNPSPGNLGELPAVFTGGNVLPVIWANHNVACASFQLSLLTRSSSDRH